MPNLYDCSECMTASGKHPSTEAQVHLSSLWGIPDYVFGVPLEISKVIIRNHFHAASRAARDVLVSDEVCSAARYRMLEQSDKRLDDFRHVDFHLDHVFLVSQQSVSSKKGSHKC